jgi:hypothetical protein
VLDSIEIIYTKDVMPLCKKALTKMRANKSGTSGNKNAFTEVAASFHDISSVEPIFLVVCLINPAVLPVTSGDKSAELCLRSSSHYQFDEEASYS